MSMFFDGSATKRRDVSLGGVRSVQDRDGTLRSAHAQRLERQMKRKREAASVTMQAAVRSFLARARLRRGLRQWWDDNVAQLGLQDMAELLRAFRFFFQPAHDSARLETMCKLLMAVGTKSKAGETLPFLESNRNFFRRRVTWILTRAIYPTAPVTAILTMLFFTDATAWSGDADVVVELLSALCQHGLIKLLYLRLSESPLNPQMLAAAMVLITRCLQTGLPDILWAFATEYMAADLSSPTFSAVTKRLVSSLPLETLLGIISAHVNTAEGALFDEPALFLINYLTLFAPLSGSMTSDILHSHVTLLTMVLSDMPLLTLKSTRDDPDLDEDDLSESMMVQLSPEAQAKIVKLSQLLLDRSHVTSCLRLTEELDSSFTTTERTYAVCGFFNLLQRLTDSVSERVRLLNDLAFKPGFIVSLWRWLSQTTYLSQLRDVSVELGASEFEQLLAFLQLFADTYNHLLVTLDDSEFLSGSLFPLDEMVAMVEVIRDVTIVLLWQKEATDKVEHLRTSLSKLFTQLYGRNSRLKFCPDDTWICQFVGVNVELLQHLTVAEFRTGSSEESFGPRTQSIQRTVRVLKNTPFVVPFQQRVKTFLALVHSDREYYSDDRRMHYEPPQHLKIRRQYLYEDAFESLNAKRAGLRGRVRIQMINEQGLEEAGVDGGGLFREFLADVLKKGLDPSLGFFKATDDEALYPSPASHLASELHLQHLAFIGRMLGKAMYMGMLQEIPLASFFLNKLLGQRPFVNDLASLDPEMHKNLMFLKTFEGDFESLALTFTVTSDLFGAKQEVDLIPNGSNTPVTKENRIRYIYHMADYLLNTQLREQSAAFRYGLSDLINPEWLRLFNAQELQMLISGAEASIDIEDLKANTNYSGGFHDNHPTINLFWAAIATFNDEELRSLIKFVTSCPRPPLLGFGWLYPKFCIHSAGEETDRLPTSSTCMNLLKLPKYQDFDSLREKLLYAIKSGAGFELS